MQGAMLDGNVSNLPRRRNPSYRNSGAIRLRNALRRVEAHRLVDCLDGRTDLTRELRGWKAQVEADRGGDLTATQRALLDLVTRDLLFWSTLDGWLASKPSLVGVRRRTAWGVLDDRRKLPPASLPVLTALGLGRKAQPLDLAGQSRATRADRRAAAAAEAMVRCGWRTTGSRGRAGAAWEGRVMTAK